MVFIHEKLEAPLNTAKNFHIKFKLLCLEYKCLDHSGIYTRINGGQKGTKRKCYLQIEVWG